MTEFARDTVKPSADNPAAPRVLRWLPAAFLLGVIGLGAVATLAVPAVRSWPVGRPTVNGEAMSTYEKISLDPNVPWRDAGVSLWGGLNYRLFGEARPGAVVGHGGWLYTNEEFETAPSDDRELRDKLRYAGQVRRELARSGARLVVALIPAKARLYAAELGGVRVPAVKAAEYETFRRGLEAEGIVAPDLHTALRRARAAGSPNLFFRTDTHWTPAGAGVAARVVASRVRSLGLELPEGKFRVVQAAPTSYHGDLLRYLPGVTPAADWVRSRSTERLDTGGGGLLGDEGIAVTLVGTSYSAASQANTWDFAGQLQQALGTTVLDAAQTGRGPLLPMRDYLLSQDRISNPPRIVIWEIPERYLRVNYPEMRTSGTVVSRPKAPNTSSTKGAK